MDNRLAYLPTLDGWRAIAILGVIASHSFASTYATRHGALGVNLFFALSGFLITAGLLHEEAVRGRVLLRHFYIRRAFRILPAALFYLAVMAIVAACGVIQSSGRDFLSCLAFVRNYAGADAQHGWYTGHFWSLSVEEHFYLVWPALLIAAGVVRARWLAPALAVALALWRSLDMRHGWVASFFHSEALRNHPFRTDYRLDSLLWGCALALLLGRARSPRLAIQGSWAAILSVCALAAVVALDVFQPQSYMAAQAFLFPVVLFGALAGSETWLGRALEWSPLRWLGRLSYSLYLWQQPFVSQYHHGLAQRFPLNLLLAVACAVVSRYAIELPAIRLGRRLLASPTPAPRVRAMAAAGSLG